MMDSYNKEIKRIGNSTMLKNINRWLQSIYKIQHKGGVSQLIVGESMIKHINDYEVQRVEGNEKEMKVYHLVGRQWAKSRLVK